MNSPPPTNDVPGILNYFIYEYCQKRMYNKTTICSYNIVMTHEDYNYNYYIKINIPLLVDKCEASELYKEDNFKPQKF